MREVDDDLGGGPRSTGRSGPPGREPRAEPPPQPRARPPDQRRGQRGQGVLGVDVADGADVELAVSMNQLAAALEDDARPSPGRFDRRRASSTSPCAAPCEERRSARRAPPGTTTLATSSRRLVGGVEHRDATGRGSPRSAAPGSRGSARASRASRGGRAQKSVNMPTGRARPWATPASASLAASMAATDRRDRARRASWPGAVESRSSRRRVVEVRSQRRPPRDGTRDAPRHAAVHRVAGRTPCRSCRWTTPTVKSRRLHSGGAGITPRRDPVPVSGGWRRRSPWATAPSMHDMQARRAALRDRHWGDASCRPAGLRPEIMAVVHSRPRPAHLAGPEAHPAELRDGVGVGQACCRVVLPQPTPGSRSQAAAPSTRSRTRRRPRPPSSRSRGEAVHAGHEAIAGA